MMRCPTLMLVMTCFFVQLFSLNQADVLCYTCLGQRLENCETETVRCNNVCFKMVDTEHGVIYKGCHTTDAVNNWEGEEAPQAGKSANEKSDKVVETISTEPLQGMTYYCDSGDRCNLSPNLNSGKWLPCLMLLLTSLLFIEL